MANKSLQDYIEEVRWQVHLNRDWIDSQLKFHNLESQELVIRQVGSYFADLLTPSGDSVIVTAYGQEATFPEHAPEELVYSLLVIPSGLLDVYEPISPLNNHEIATRLLRENENKLRSHSSTG